MPSEIPNWTIEVLAVVIAMAVYIYRSEKQLKVLSAHIFGAEERNDSTVDGETKRSLKWYLDRQEKLLAERRMLPGMDLWSITKDNWKRDVMRGAEKLRNLIPEAYGIGTPDEHSINKRADEVRISEDLAHDLVVFARSKNELACAEVEWMVKKIEILGMTRKIAVRFEDIAVAEMELRQIEAKIDQIRAALPRQKKSVYESFSALSPISG